MTDLTANLFRVYRELLANPGDRLTMCVLADLLEDADQPDLARAYRWAAENGKWPFKRTYRARPANCNVYDWDRENRDWSYLAESVPLRSRIPNHLIRHIVIQKDRKYGGVNRAFILLARALAAYPHTYAEVHQ